MGILLFALLQQSGNFHDTVHFTVDIRAAGMLQSCPNATSLRAVIAQSV
jgi:hypothetical protein